jgi:hypothetical protein
MDAEIRSIRKNFENVLEGSPWYGTAVYKLMERINPEDTFRKIDKDNHSMVELVYHMLTWSEFTLAILEKAPASRLASIEDMDWRPIDPVIHSWHKGLDALKSVNRKILVCLDGMEDEILKEIVPCREYNYRFLLNGLIQHLIYHSGQIIFIHKALEK